MKDRNEIYRLYREAIDRRATGAWAEVPTLLTVAGSHAHGTDVPPEDPHGTDDVDLVAVVANPVEYYASVSGFHHTREGFDTNGDHVDLVVYDLVKFVSLLGKGNPNVHFWLWADHMPAWFGPAGNLLVANRERLLSQRMFPALAGYAIAQMKKMRQGHTQGYMGAKRKDLLRHYGYDIKDASHCIRLLHVGRALAETGRVMVQLTGEPLAEVMAIKTGQWPFGQVERRAEELFALFEHARASSSLRPEVPREELDALCARAVLMESERRGEPRVGVE